MSGLAGISTWPAYNRVEHVQPVGSVVVNVSRFTSDQAILILSTGDVVDAQYSDINGVITIPAADIENAISRRQVITLKVGSNSIGGYIKFLPPTSRIQFNDSGILKSDGSVMATGYEVVTDYTDIRGASDLTYSGRISTANPENFASVCGYDENRNFVKVVVPAMIATPPAVVHVVPDGTYVYVRACKGTSAEGYLEVTFPDRRTRRKVEEKITDDPSD